MSVVHSFSLKRAAVCKGFALDLKGCWSKSGMNNSMKAKTCYLQDDSLHVGTAEVHRILLVHLFSCRFSTE